jgi:general secretion pathway protein D
MGTGCQGGSGTMIRPRIALASILALLLSAPSYADGAKAAYKEGVRAESHKQYDAAYEAFKRAYTLKPKDTQYQTSFLRARAYAAAQHVANGLKLRNEQKLQEALEEFKRGAEIDSTNYVAAQEMRRTAEMLNRQAETGSAAPVKTESLLAKLAAGAEGPVELEPSPNTPITLRMSTTADNIYRAIGKLAGVNVLFDLDYKPQRITIELSEVMPREALRMVALESKTFWRPISTTAIFVAAEGKRKELESSILKTFYLRNASNAELQEVAGTLKGILEMSRIQVNPTHSSITLRGTTDQLVLAEKLISDADKAKSEVVIDIAVMELSRDRLNNWGAGLPTSTTITPVAPGGTSGPSVNFGSLNGNKFSIPIPSATFTLLSSDSNAKVLQRPQLRALDDEKATLRIGDRIPIATGSFAAAISSGGGIPLVNTQFQYIDVGVNIDITPHVHSDGDVTLKMVLEVSSLAGTTTIGGITQPTIGQRRIEHETRLQDGEVNLVGGILEDTETRSLSGYPWVTKIPILKYLFAQENKERTEDEIVFAITPHIVRAEEITDDNQRMIDVGTNGNIGLRYKEPKPVKTKNSSANHATPSQGQGQKSQPASLGNATASTRPSGTSNNQ